ncbi:hypothetical protein ACJRO7_032236 [Eucalyptus globulus]|uniref:Uncharacterized protein n=1 Tax=Eucalyptus globulus TaxID=34317 RepID=A0ABD3JIL3_EUCGL
MIGAGGDSGAGFGCNSEISADQEMGSVFESFKARCPALFEDCVGDGDGFSTLPESLAIGGGISEEESMLRDLEGYGYNPNHFLTLENLDVPLRCKCEMHLIFLIELHGP